MVCELSARRGEQLLWWWLGEGGEMGQTIGLIKEGTHQGLALMHCITEKIGAVKMHPVLSSPSYCFHVSIWFFY